MSQSLKIIGGLVLTSLVAVSYICQAEAQAPPVPTPQNAGPSQDNMLPDPEVLEQGPIHEAFAEPLAFGQDEVELVAKEPPMPIQELPPDEQPEGRNVEWIPGYFMFDQERDDFVWVSGLWRDVPPGRTWIPGEWQQVDGDWQWVHGFWSDAKQEVRLLPNPPDSLEAGPSSPAPGEDYLWAPGSWSYQNTGYAWQAGFWYQAQPNWVWVPNHYSYTPGGCVFVNGYWDYPAQSRGWLYAPVYWSGGYGGYGNNYYYRPRSVINTGLLLANLFVNNRYGGYYYGYNRGGGHPGWLRPWGSNYGNWGNYGHRGHGHHGGYDPLWAHNKWNNRNGNNHSHGPNGGNHRDGDRHVGTSSRGDLRDGRGNNFEGRGRQNGKLVTSIDDFKKDYQNFDGKDRKVRQLNENEVAKVRDQASKYRNFDRARIGLDSKAKVNANIAKSGNRSGREGNSTVQGRILRQGDSDSLQGKLRSQGNLDARNRGRENSDNPNRGRGGIETRLGGSNQTELNRGERNSTVRSNTQLENRARIQRDGRDSSLGNNLGRSSNEIRQRLDRATQSGSTNQGLIQSRGSVNQRIEGSRQQGVSSTQSNRRELFYRGAPQQGTNQQQQSRQQLQQGIQQRTQQKVPQSRSLQDSIRQNYNPLGNSRVNGSSGSPSIRSNNRVYQGSGRNQGSIQTQSRSQGGQQAIQQRSNSSSQSRGSIRSGGNSGGSNRSFSGNRSGGGGGNQASGGNRGGGGSRQGGGKKGR